MQKYRCKTCGGQMVATMGLYGVVQAGAKEWNEMMADARNAQKSKRLEFRHLTGGCDKPNPEIAKRTRN